MLSQEDNEILTRVGAGTLMGDLLAHRIKIASYPVHESGGARSALTTIRSCGKPCFRIAKSAYRNKISGRLPNERRS